METRKFVEDLGERTRNTDELARKAESQYGKFREMIGSRISIINPDRNYSNDDLSEDPAYKILTSISDFADYSHRWLPMYPNNEKLATDIMRNSSSMAHSLIHGLRGRSMTQPEYNSILDKTHPDLKEAFEKMNDSDKKARKLYSYKTPLSQYLYSFCLSRFDKAYIKYLEDEEVKGGNE